MAKTKTNEQLLRGLLKDLNTYEAAILRERLLKIAELTRQDIKENPENYENFVCPPQIMIAVCDKIDHYLKIE